MSCSSINFGAISEREEKEDAHKINPKTFSSRFAAENGKSDLDNKLRTIFL